MAFRTSPWDFSEATRSGRKPHPPNQKSKLRLAKMYNQLPASSPKNLAPGGQVHLMGVRRPKNTKEVKSAHLNSL
jgi:hypothetical protein